MISLMVQLLKEVQGAPKAVILAGAPGAGKSSIVGDIIRFRFKNLNIDDFFIANLKASGVSLDLKKADAEGRSKAASCNASKPKNHTSKVRPRY
jgi:chloramphenicol 3-O-phosphotransferase